MMIRIMPVMVLLLAVQTPVFACEIMINLEDFHSYSPGESVKGSGNGFVTWDTGNGYIDEPGWSDPMNALVVANNGERFLSINTNDHTSTGGYSHLAGLTGVSLDIPDIEHQGTIYFHFRLDDDMNIAIATNGLASSSFCIDSSQAECQQTHDWQRQASIAWFDLPGQKAAGATDGLYPFKARDGDAYADSVNYQFNCETWYEMWIQLDVDNHYARYFMRDMNSWDDPIAILNASGSDQWNFRDQTYTSMTTLKFNIIGSPVFNCDNGPNGDCKYQEMLIDNIRVDTTALSLEDFKPPRPGSQPCREPNALYGDFNCDNLVNLLDLVILGENYNTSVKLSVSFLYGDTNHDGLINLVDLTTLGENYNTTLPTPEPTTAGIMIMAGLLLRRKR